MDYTFTACLITAIICAWIGAFIVYTIGKDHYARAKFFMEYASSSLKEVYIKNDQIQALRSERDRALSDVAKLERKLGQIVHAQEEFSRLANEALEAALARPQVEPILAPTVTDATTWKALLLACDALANATDEKPDPDAWLHHYLGLAGSNKDTPS